MIAYREALELVLQGATALRSQEVALDEALGLVAAVDVVAAEPVPPFVNSGVDGFAVRAADVAEAREDAPVRLRVPEDVPAGHVAQAEVARGTALRIMTGAPLPVGSDAVVPVEDTSSSGDAVEVRRAVRARANVRPAGEDVSRGTRVVERGVVLRPGDIGVLAEIGCARVRVVPRARVAVITTGDELVDVTERPGPGRIRDANLHALCAQLTACGAVPLPFPRIPDEAADVTRALRGAWAAADVVVTTGGVSMGERDRVKDVLGEMSAERVFWRVAQKPAGPLGFWRLTGKPVFGAPGNPVAAMLTVEEYVRPLLRRMMGHARLFRPEVEGVLEEPWARRAADERLHFARVVARVVEGEWRARLAGPQGSGVLSSLARANALALISAGATELPAGSRVTLHLIEEPEDH
jgi:molybdopterin molybdotransferase